MLHITNGDSVVNTWKQTDLPGIFLAWRDALHDGPVPANLSLERLSIIRARYVATNGWATFEDAANDFDQRDRQLTTYRDHDEVVLWFEHDLFDQLQMIQLLDWFARRELGRTKLSLICISAFPGVEPFHGLGQLTAEQLASLFPARQQVSRAQLEIGSHAWAAFTAPEPAAIEDLLEQDLSCLPHLKSVLRRHLQQFPSLQNGLSRTENQCLEALSRGSDTPAGLFRAVQQMEEAPFMGDWSFYLYLKRLSSGGSPVVQAGNGLDLPNLHNLNEKESRAGSVSITEAGRRVLSADLDCVRLNGIDRWLGGVHLSSGTASWRWDKVAGKLKLLR